MLVSFVDKEGSVGCCILLRRKLKIILSVHGEVRTARWGGVTAWYQIHHKQKLPQHIAICDIRTSQMIFLKLVFIEGQFILNIYKNFAT